MILSILAAHPWGYALLAVLLPGIGLSLRIWKAAQLPWLKTICSNRWSCCSTTTRV